LLSYRLQTLQLEAKLARLERLSRALQSERSELLQRLRQYEPNPKVNQLTKPKKKNGEVIDKPKNHGGSSIFARMQFKQSFCSLSWICWLLLVSLCVLRN